MDASTNLRSARRDDPPRARRRAPTSPRAVLVGGIGWLALAAVPSLRHALRLATTPSPLAHDVLHDAVRVTNAAVEPCADSAPPC